MKTKRQRSFGTGFTLVEMLAVIAVIMILMGLLLPVIGKTRAKSIRTQCLSNIKQVDLLLLMYGQDNSDRLPQTASVTSLPLPLVDLALRGRISHQIFYDPGIDGQASNWFNVSTDPGRQIGYCLALPGPFALIQTNANATIMPQPISPGANVLLPPPNASQRVLVAGVTKVTPRLGFPLSAGDGAHLDSKGWIPGDSVAMLDGSAKWRKFRDMIARSYPLGAPATFWW